MITRAITITENKEEGAADFTYEGEVSTFDEAGERVLAEPLDAKAAASLFPTQKSEPKAKAVGEKNGPLPDGFPHRGDLENAGHTTYAKVRKLVATGPKWYVDVPGIGEKTAPDVEAALA